MENDVQAAPPHIVLGKVQAFVSGHLKNLPNVAKGRVGQGQDQKLDNPGLLTHWPQPYKIMPMAQLLLNPTLATAFGSPAPTANRRTM